MRFVSTSASTSSNALKYQFRNTLNTSICICHAPSTWTKPTLTATSLSTRIPSTYTYASFHASALKRLEGRIDENAQIPAAESTIYALSTAPGRAAIAVIRVSGPACTDIYEALCPGRPLPSPRYATLRTLYDPIKYAAEPNSTKGDVLDSNALILYFPAPKTVTGEDVLELHVHGGPAVVNAVLAAIPRCKPKPEASLDIGLSVPPIRYAEPGEFTRRAFMNNRLDLMQVEALGNTLTARTEQQRRLSVRGTTSGLAKRYESWRQQLLHARGELEALIDFSEDQHFDESPSKLASSVAAQVATLQHLIKAHSVNAARGELLRSGISICLLGAPNVGKSSLLNAVVGREAAIVSHEAGTTRDVVEVGIDLGGYYCRFSDTAGLRPTSKMTEVGEVEMEGIKRAKQRALDADIIILVAETRPLKHDSQQQGFSIELLPAIIDLATECCQHKSKLIFAINKADQVSDFADSVTLATRINDILQRLPSSFGDRAYLISCKDAQRPGDSDSGGIQHFLEALKSMCHDVTAAQIPIVDGQQADASVWEESLGATERQRLLLDECIDHLGTFLAPFKSSKRNEYALDEEEIDIVVAAESLRAAATCLAKITGKGDAGDVEEVLGVVFEK